MKYKLELSDSQKAHIFEKIKKKYLREQYPSTNPQGVILGGQPGSGKSKLPPKITQEFKEDFIFISTDDLRRHHPAYKGLQQNPETFQNAANDVSIYANDWTEKLIKYCIENKYNLIIDSTLGYDLEITYKTIDMFKSNGYQVHLRVMSVPSIISKLSIFVRNEDQLAKKGFARWTLMKDHDNRFKELETNLFKIINAYELSSLKFYERVFDDYETIGLECVESYLDRKFKSKNFPYVINIVNKLSDIIEETGRNKLDFETFVKKDLSSLVGFEKEVQKFNSYIIELVKSNETSAVIDIPAGIQEFSNTLKYEDSEQLTKTILPQK
jgi:predicted ABC-type ATPase